MLCRVSIDGSSVSNLLTHMKTVAIDRSATTPMLVVATPSNAPVVDLTADQAKNDQSDATAEGNIDALVETKESFRRLLHVLVYRHFTLFSVPQAVDKPLLDNRKDEKNATRKKAKDGVSDDCSVGRIIVDGSLQLKTRLPHFFAKATVIQPQLWSLDIHSAIIVCRDKRAFRTVLTKSFQEYTRVLLRHGVASRRLPQWFRPLSRYS